MEKDRVSVIRIRGKEVGEGVRERGGKREREERYIVCKRGNKESARKRKSKKPLIFNQKTIFILIALFQSIKIIYSFFGVV